MALSYSKRLDNLRSICAELALAPEKPVFEDSYVMSGLISKFKIGFDVAWKLMKDLLIEHYMIDDWAKGSPREAIEQAFHNGLIDDATTWLEMLRMRNTLSHDYNGLYAEDCAHEIIERYIPFLDAFNQSMERLVASFDDKDGQFRRK